MPRSKTTPSLCRICSSPAVGCYFGAIACRACKTFFRRHADADADQSRVRCLGDGQCSTDVTTRHQCSACRLRKCFECGMTTDKFRTLKWKKTTGSQLALPSTQIRTVNLLNGDTSSLTKDQWTLLSNLLNCYHESNVLPLIESLKVREKGPSMTYTELVDEFLRLVYDTSGVYLRCNADLCQLASEERCSIVRSATEHVTCLSGSFLMHHYQLYQNDLFLHTMIGKYGQRTMDIHQFGRRFIVEDHLLAKLAFALFALSQHRSLINKNNDDDEEVLPNSLRIVQIQHRYADVAWKYLFYKYGHERSVKLFLRVTSWLITITTLLFHAQTLQVHLNDMTNLVEHLHLQLICDHLEQNIASPH